MSTSPTPRTDKAAQDTYKQRDYAAVCMAQIESDQSSQFVTSNFARNLERELAAARAELALHEDNARQSLEEIEALRANFTEWHRRALAFEDERNQARAELAALRAEQTKPLDRPDKPGHWWRWCDIFKKWEGPLWISLPAQTSPGKWLPAAPPRDLREGGE